jgi:hypothetical protein
VFAHLLPGSQRESGKEGGKNRASDKHHLVWIPIVESDPVSVNLAACPGESEAPVAVHAGLPVILAGISPTALHTEIIAATVFLAMAVMVRLRPLTVRMVTM